jgi:hypothetical protein
MSHVRTQLRTAARAALIAALSDVTWVKSYWSQVTNRSQLPRGGVATPRTVTRQIDVGFVDRAVDLVVIVKREGDEDLEDTMDADAVRIEEALAPVMQARSDDFDLVEENFEVDAKGDVPVGTLSMLFRVGLKTDESNPD